MPQKTAVIIGASMAGLVAARALSDHFDRVLVLDRDELPAQPEIRSGVPQGKHIHALLVEGQERLERMFPGLTQELTESGSPRMIWCLESAYMASGRWFKRFDSGMATNVITRADLEWRVRRRLQANPKIEFLHGRDVRGLIGSADKARVIGVETTHRDSHEPERHMGDLIVDASGRGSKAPEWLTALGYDAPSETNVNSYVGYATRLYKKPDKAFDWKILFCTPNSVENMRSGGGIFDIGHGYWQVTLGGMNKDYPPTDPDAFLEFAKTLPTHALYDLIKDAEPASAVSGYRIAGSRLRHYDALPRRPENFILMGDSVCAFNPIYGQGMTVSAIEADALSAMLAQHGTRDLTGFAAKYQKRIARLLQNAWVLSTGEDLRFPGTEGDRAGGMTRLIQRYVDLYIRAATDDADLTLGIVQVLNLSAPPTVLFQPHRMIKVLRTAAKQRRHGAPPDQRHLIPVAP